MELESVVVIIEENSVPTSTLTSSPARTLHSNSCWRLSGNRIYKTVTVIALVILIILSVVLLYRAWNFETIHSNIVSFVLPVSSTTQMSTSAQTSTTTTDWNDIPN